MAGTFIISLDCEGKWGMADKITPEHDRLITEDNLVEAYRTLLDVFGRYRIPATFAYVMAFTLSGDERAQLRDRIRDVRVDGENWLRHYRAAESRGNLDGWYCPLVFDMTQARQEHEIGCHGFTHAPLAEHSIDAADAEAELDSATAAARIKGVTLETLVYPRNQVGYRELVAKHGYAGYRERLSSRSGPAARLMGLARELNLNGRAQAPMAPELGMARIPPGYFFNWRQGYRAAVPKVATRARWKAIMEDAARTGGVAHLWLHPHNLITGPGTGEVLAQVIGDAARLRDQGRIEVLTQADYVRRERAG